MRDFTLNTLNELLITLKTKDYKFQTFADFIRNPATKSVILRHDVDARITNSIATARIEYELGIIGTYYFRIVPESFDEEVIKKIANLGHEVGYHYEDFVTAHGDCGLAIKQFEENLAKLRRFVTVETICMHGSPLSKYDNRVMWEKYNYRDYGIIGEPYLDINFDEVFYLTDTGRRWDGEAVNLRDKASGVRRQAFGKEGIGTQNSEPVAQNSKSLILNSELKLYSTFYIIEAAVNDALPNKIMITIHPQRWNRKIMPWIIELVWQNVKNVVKKVIQQRLGN